jgi:hypothetical protein
MQGNIYIYILIYQRSNDPLKRVEQYLIEKEEKQDIKAYALIFNQLMAKRNEFHRKHNN